MSNPHGLWTLGIGYDYVYICDSYATALKHLADHLAESRFLPDLKECVVVSACDGTTDRHVVPINDRNTADNIAYISETDILTMDGDRECY